jgi:hypothetical protein
MAFNLNLVRSSEFVQIWSSEPLAVNTWYAGWLPAEQKGDELGIGAGYKIDIPAPCWALYRGKERDWHLVQVKPEISPEEQAEGWQHIGHGAHLLEVTAEPAPEPGPRGPNPNLSPNPNQSQNQSRNQSQSQNPSLSQNPSQSQSQSQSQSPSPSPNPLRSRPCRTWLSFGLRTARRWRPKGRYPLPSTPT